MEPLDPTGLDLVMSPCKTGVVVSCFRGGQLLRTCTVSLADLAREEMDVLTKSQCPMRG